VPKQEKPRAAGLLVALSRRVLGYDTGTVIVSEVVLSSKSVSVASPKWTSVTVAVHIGFGHDPAGAVGETVVTVKRNEPFLGVS
jgi:hypothetical protein